MNIFYMGGWAYPERSSFEGVNSIAWWTKEKEIREKLMQEREVILVGWSLGAYKLFSFLELENVKGGIFFCLSHSFVKTDKNPHGWPSRVLDRMKKKIVTNKKGGVEDFQKKVGVRFATNFSEELLINGLDELRLARLKAYKGDKKVWMIGGGADEIVPSESSGLFASECDATFFLVQNKNHGLVFSDGERILKKFLGDKNESK